MKEHKLPFNIQFFADEEVLVSEVGGEEPTVTESVQEEGAEITTEDTPSEPSEETQEVAEPVQTPDVNAHYAALRRKAEEEARRKYESEMKKRDAEIARIFGGHVNPVTGKPIQSVDDYLQAYTAQQQAQVEEQLKSSGVDPILISQFIANNPAVLKAQEILEKQEVEMKNRQIEDDISEISKINPSIKSIEDLGKDPSFQRVYEKWQQSNGALSLYDAYRLENYETLASKKAEAAKQAAINQVKGKSHLETSKGVSTSDNMVDIPDKELPVWREIYPDLTLAQLKEKYNKTL